MKPHMFKPPVLLAQARRDLGLSQRDLANRLNVSLQEVWRWENGIAHPYPRHRQLLCTFFQKTAEELGLDPVNTGLSESVSAGNPLEAQLRAFLESCCTYPIYQEEYQAFIRRRQQFYRHQHCSVSFIDWFLAVHPEQAAAIENFNANDSNQPA
ncbi:MAG TPA: helix-turn-helix transcriptional regulator [Ktedonobacteraceae bacterium]|nr:helix-turn-helix transcriptional regulator [Ktedonobacteraceae bacterium]